MMLVISGCHAGCLPLGDHSVWSCWVFLYVTLVKHPSIFFVFTILGRLFRARHCSFLDIGKSYWWGTDLLLPSLTIFSFCLCSSNFALWLGTKVEIRTRRCILMSHGLRGSDGARRSTFAHSGRNLIPLLTLLQFSRWHNNPLWVLWILLLQGLFLYVFLYEVLVRLSGRWCSAAVERGAGLHANCRIQTRVNRGSLFCCLLLLLGLVPMTRLLNGLRWLHNGSINLQTTIRCNIDDLTNNFAKFTRELFQSLTLKSF